MGIFIGGDTASVDYAFDLKVAGSTAECPMKLYKGAIDVNNPPSPFTYPQQVADFAGKVVGSTIENPNVAKALLNSVLLAPSVSGDGANGFIEQNQSGYNASNTLNGLTCSTTTASNGQIAQQLFSFNLIQIFERTYGTIPGSTDTASKVAWLKANIASVTANAYVYGSCPSGNKVCFTEWTGSAWYATPAVNATNAVVKLSQGFITSELATVIDASGFIYFLAYTDASNGTIASVVNTDYISLTVNYKDQASVTWWQEVTDQKTLDKLKVQNEIPITSTDFTNRTALWNGKSLVLQTDTIPAVRDDFAGKVVADTVVNPNKYLFSIANVLQNPTNVTGNWTTGLQECNFQPSMDLIKSLNGTNDSASTLTVGQTPQQLFSFNLIRMLEDKYGTLPCPNDTASKVAWLKQNISKITVNWYGYGSCPSGNKASLFAWNANSSSWYGLNVNTASSPVLITANSVANFNNSSFIDTSGFIHFNANTDASNGTISSTIYTDYISLDVQLKPTAGYDLLVPSNPRRDSVINGNYDNIVMAEKVYNQIISDFTDKVANSTTENPNISKYKYSASLLSPIDSSWQEGDIYHYNGIKSLDGNLSNYGSTSANGQIPQQLFQFNLVAIFEKQYGTIPATDKVSWLKANIPDIGLTFYWYGYGSCPSGNKAWVAIYKDSVGWVDASYNNANSPTQITWGNIFKDGRVDSNGMIYFLAYTSASDGVTTSTIYTDYVKLKLTFNNNNNAIEYFTNNSVEMAVQTTNKASAYLVECDLTPVCNALYGSSNSALLSALKAIQADVYASGYGSSSNDVSNGCNMNIWYDDRYNAAHYNNDGSNTTNFVTKITKIFSDTYTKNRITASNKIYLLITSTNNSTIDVPSVVNLDYLNIRVDLTRVPDVISNPPTINLTDTWSMLIRGFSPAWDNNKTNYPPVFFIVKDSSNAITCQYDSSIGFYINKQINGSFSGDYINIPQTFNKYQLFNLLVQQDSSGMTFRLLKNNGSMSKGVNNNTALNNFTGTLHFLSSTFNLSSINADAFLDSIVYMPNQIWDDAQAEAILRGTKEGFEFPELFDINSLGLGVNSVLSNGVLTITNSGANWANCLETMNVLPNNQYVLNGNVTGVGGLISIVEYYNNIQLRVTNSYALTPSNSSYTFTTSPKTNKIQIRIGSDRAVTSTFSNISLKLKM